MPPGQIPLKRKSNVAFAAVPKFKTRPKRNSVEVEPQKHWLKPAELFKPQLVKTKNSGNAKMTDP